MTQKAQVAMIMGSKNDFAHLKSGVAMLKDFGVSVEVRVMSAHRTPADVVQFVSEAEAEGTQVFICAAGMAAHLGGVVAAHTTRPVIGIPLACEPFNGLDALFSTVQMPPGIPVATVTAGPAGAKNAALIAISILALQSESLAQKLKDFREKQTAEVRKADAALQAEIANA